MDEKRDCRKTRKGRSLRKKPIRGVFRLQSPHSSPGGFAPGPFPAARRRRNPRAPGNALPSITVARRDRRSAGRNGGGTGPGQREPQRGPRKGGRAHPCRRGAGGPPASQLQPPKRGRARAGQGLPAPPGAAETPPTTTQPPRGERPNRTAGGPGKPGNFHAAAFLFGPEDGHKAAARDTPRGDSPGPGRRGGPCGPAWRHGRRGDTAEAGAIVWPGVGRRVARILNPRFPS